MLTLAEDVLVARPLSEETNYLAKDPFIHHDTYVKICQRLESDLGHASEPAHLSDKSSWDHPTQSASP